MPSFHLTPEGALTFRPLPGRALLRVSPAELMIGGLHLPEKAAEGMTQRQAARAGTVVRVNGGVNWARKGATRDHLFSEEELKGLTEGKRVWYLGHMDEMDNDFVVVRIGQIVVMATEEDT